MNQGAHLVWGERELNATIIIHKICILLPQVCIRIIIVVLRAVSHILCHCYCRRVLSWQDCPLCHPGRAISQSLWNFLWQCREISDPMLVWPVCSSGCLSLLLLVNLWSALTSTPSTAIGRYPWAACLRKHPKAVNIQTLDIKVVRKSRAKICPSS